MISRTVMRGFRLEYGSWKISLILCLACLSSLPFSARKSCPQRVMRPSVGSMRRMTDCIVVDFPQPLSPTMPSTSPACSSKLTSSHARTTCLTSPENAARRTG